MSFCGSRGLLNPTFSATCEPMTMEPGALARSTVVGAVVVLVMDQGLLAGAVALGEGEAEVEALADGDALGDGGGVDLDVLGPGGVAEEEAVAGDPGEVAEGEGEDQEQRKGGGGAG